MTEKKILTIEDIDESRGWLESLKTYFKEAGQMCLFTMRFLREVFVPRYEWKALIKQSYVIGYKSLPLIAVTGLIIGLVLTIQARPTMAQFGAESWIPSMVAISIIREMGPVMVAIIFAGKVGSGIGAELASMKVTEQIDAMEVSGINPFKFLVVTRVVACTLMLPILVVAADGLSLLGAYAGVNLTGDLSFQLFVTQAFANVTFTDILPAITKTFFFGLAIGIVSCYKGYNANKGTEGVGAAANSAVVIGSLMVFIIDMISVQLTSLLY